MNNPQMYRLVNQLVRMFRRGGNTRWLAIALVVGVGALYFIRPDLLGNPSTSDQRPTVSEGSGSKGSGSEGSGSEGSGQTSSTTVGGVDASTRRDNDSGENSGELIEVSKDVYRSPAGLVYTRGSRHGHRLKHVLFHGNDEPGRPGQHGVFGESTQRSIVGLLDEAYRKCQSNDRSVRRKDEDQRTVYTVDMGREVGYVGGQRGNQRGKPSAHHIRMVLEGGRVITAYPVVP